MQGGNDRAPENEGSETVRLLLSTEIVAALPSLGPTGPTTALVMWLTSGERTIARPELTDPSKGYTDASRIELKKLHQSNDGLTETPIQINSAVMCRLRAMCKADGGHINRTIVRALRNLIQRMNVDESRASGVQKTDAVAEANPDGVATDPVVPLRGKETFRDNVRPSIPRVQGLDVTARTPDDNVVHLYTHSLTRDYQQRTIPNVSNVMLILEQDPEWHGVFGFDDFSQRVALRREAPKLVSCAIGQHWTDANDTEVAASLQRPPHQIQTLNIDAVRRAIRAVAGKHRFHSWRDELDALAWDGVERLGSWLPSYVGVEDSRWSRLVGPKFVLSMVARAYRPGCQVDTILILEGEQGLRKSSALRALAGPGHFLDDVDDLLMKPRDAAKEMVGKAIVEWMEINAMMSSRQNGEKFKKALRKREDEYVDKYDKHSSCVPRGFVFAGSVNVSQYLHDETGNRSYWPVRVVRRADDSAIERDRAQLLAEAVHRFKAGEQWWLASDEEKLARREQDARFEGDAWDVTVLEYVRSLESVGIGEILAHIFRDVKNASDVRIERWDDRALKRVARILTRHGWIRRRESLAEVHSRGRVARQWRYYPKKKNKSS